MPFISLIIPTYNRSKLLAEALESLRSQEFKDFEVIVIDDGSTDDTAAMLAGLPESNVRVLRQANAGQGAARNLGITEARGEYCAFLDSDDLFFPWTLSIIAEAIAANDRPGVILGQVFRFNAPDEFRAAQRVQLKTTIWPDLYAYAKKNALGATGSLVARTELLKATGGFLTERIVGEDADLMLRLGVAPKLVKIDEPVMYGYRVHPQNFTGDLNRWYDGACSLIRRFRDGGYPGGPIRLAEIRKLIADDIAYFSLICLCFGGRRNFIRLYFKMIGSGLWAGNIGLIFKMPAYLILNLLGKWPSQRSGVTVHAQLNRAWEGMR